MNLPFQHLRPFPALALAILLLSPYATSHADTGVRIGLQDRIAHAVLSLAEARGDFAAEGVEVRLVGPWGAAPVLDAGSPPGAASPLEALLEDEVDLLAIGADALIEAERDGMALRGALLLGESGAADVLFGEPALQAAGALRGARIGLVSGASGRLLLAAELQRRGLDLADVQLEAMSVGEAISRWLTPGERPPLQAVVVAAPAAIVFRYAVSDEAAEATPERPVARPVIRLGDGAGHAGLITDVLAGDERWLRDNRESVKAVIRAWNRAVGALRRDRDGPITLLAERSGASAELLRRSLDGVELYGTEDNIRLLRGDFQKNFSDMSQVLARIERDRARGVPSANRFLSLSALRQVAAGR